MPVVLTEAGPLPIGQGYVVPCPQAVLLAPRTPHTAHSDFGLPYTEQLPAAIRTPHEASRPGVVRLSQRATSNTPVLKDGSYVR